MSSPFPMIRPLRRRMLLQQLSGAAVLTAIAPQGLLALSGSSQKALSKTAATGWRGGMPVFRSSTQTEGGRRFHLTGNRALQLQVGMDGRHGVYEESHGQRWLTYAADTGTGEAELQFADGSVLRSGGAAGDLVLTPTGVTQAMTSRGITLQREIICPEGDVPWLLIRVNLQLADDAAAQSIGYRELWQLRPRPLGTFEPEAKRDARAAAITYITQVNGTVVSAFEDRGDADKAFGPEAPVMLEALHPRAIAGFTAAAQPELQISEKIRLRPGVPVTRWYRCGYLSEPLASPAKFYHNNIAALTARLPGVGCPALPWVQWEMPWHAGALSGGANRDAVLGGHTLNQGSTYAFMAGGNAAARDTLQHALPLIYSEPDLALSVFKNICAWGSPDGDLPYALQANKQPMLGLFRPSDQNLWALWFAAEYALVTGDLNAFSLPQQYHPTHNAKPVSLKEHLRRQYQFFVNHVGRGARGHVRILNADWNDFAIEASGADHKAMIESGSSVLNSAMAAWVLPVFAALLDKLQEPVLAAEVRSQAESLRLLVAEAWNGRWFDRAYAPDGAAVGRDDCWLEVQPWAILCGAATTGQAGALLDYIDTHHRANSPFGARLIWPLRDNPRRGMGIHGGVWYSVNMTLIWAAAKYRPALARDGLQRMSLYHHRELQPDVWEGTVSGPDAWNAPESKRPGRTWDAPWMTMQDFPVGNMHSHSAPLLSYLRLLGVAPQSDGSMQGQPAIAGHFRSQNFQYKSKR